MLPEKWTSHKLGDLAAWQAGGTPLTTRPEFYEPASIPWANIGDLTDGYVYKTARSISDAGLQAIGGRLAETGDVLLAMYASVGLVGLPQKKMATNQAILVGRPNRDLVLPSYLAALLIYQRPTFLSRTLGSTQQNLSASLVRQIVAVLPPLAEQRRIVAVLEQADRAVEMAARHVADAEALLKAMIDTEVGRVELPDEWALRPLEQIVTQKNDWVRVAPDATYRLLGVRVRGAGAYDRGTIVGAKTKYPKFNVAEAGDLVLSKIWARNGAIAVIDSATSGCSASPEFPLFSPRQNEVLSSWLRLYMSLPRAWEDCERLAKGTSGQNRITPAQFLRMEIPLPPLAEQQAIVARIEKVEAAVRAAEAHLERLRALRSALLENLVSGRVRLPMPGATESEAAA